LLYLPETLERIHANAVGEVGPLKIFYEGTEEQWSNIVIETGNNGLSGSKLHTNQPKIII
jgi:hypothetical protein